MNLDFEGNIDLIKARHAYGWVWSPSQIDKRFEVDIYIDGKYIDSVLADFKREDLVEAGKGSGSYGFIYKIPHFYSDSKEHKISMRIDRYGYALDKELVFSHAAEEV